MKYQIQGDDLRVVQQTVINIKVKILVYELFGKHVINEIEGGVVSATSSINAESDIRRTISLTIVPNIQKSVEIAEGSSIWLDKKIQLYVGIEDRHTWEYVWWPMGYYVFIDASSTYDATNNQLTLNCSDMMALWDGSKNGQIAAQSIEIPAYKEWLMYSWIEEAKKEGKSSDSKDENLYISSATAFYNWCCMDNVDHKNKLTDISTYTAGTDIYKKQQNARNAAWKLMTDTTLTASQVQVYLAYVQKFLAEDNYTVSYQRNELVSSIITYNHIREVIIQWIKDLTKVTDNDYLEKLDLNIEEIGAKNGLQRYNSNYLAYRTAHPDWDAVPYDLEFDSGATILSVMTELVGLYKNYEHYFDVYGSYCINLIPTMVDEDVMLSNKFLQSVLISENVSLDMSGVRNIVIVYGETIDTDFYAYENVGYSDNTYTATISAMTSDDDDAVNGYFNGDLIALKIPSANAANCYININSFGAVPVYDSESSARITAGRLNANTTYVFKIKRWYDTSTSSTITQAYLLGHYQAMGLYALVGNTEGIIDDAGTKISYTTSDGVSTYKYTTEYFKDRYNVEQVNLMVIEDSPYTCQKLGDIVQVCSGGDYEDCESDASCLERAEWELYNYARLTDNITLSIKLCPFIDVDTKVEYQPSYADEPYQYIIKSISHDFSAGTTSVNMIRFYDYYVS